ncbi:asparagine synthase-related protein [Streptomyces sp. PSRA5]|uniref:asparagine synthase-related protein n=1 Tax=Streptomyces panacea TaxID=3035064 RepID=UPI00339CBDCE
MPPWPRTRTWAWTWPRTRTWPRAAASCTGRRRPKSAGCRVPGASAAAEAAPRLNSHLNLTRFLPCPPDRTDRLSMGIGPEVRVPCLDSRLVEYVFNAPWRSKTFDGREKSLPRAAVADPLPEPEPEPVPARRGARVRIHRSASPATGRS